MKPRAEKRVILRSRKGRIIAVWTASDLQKWRATWGKSSRPLTPTPKPCYNESNADKNAAL
jgi:hypothetical protein